MRFGLRPRLAIAGGIVFAAATGITLGLLNAAESRLEDQAFDQLHAVREAKAAQIEAEVGQFVANLDALAASRGASLIPDLSRAFDRLDAVDPESLADYYSVEVASRVAVDDIEALIPSSVAGQTLQTLYIASNSRPVGEKDQMENANDGSSYSALHAQVHPSFRTALNAFGAYDIFLIDDDSGNIVYSVFKEIDVGTSLLDGPYADSGLGRVWAETVETGDVAIVDFEPYLPSYLAPAAFAAQGVHDGAGTRIGTIAMQAPIDRINEVMTSKRRWGDVGLGESGETYIVAADSTMRNDSRFLIEDPGGFYAALDDAEIPTDDIARFDTTIGLLSVDTVGTRAALAGESGSDVFPDYRNVDVLSDFGPLMMPGGLDWVIMSEIDAAEAFDAAQDMRRISLVVLTTTGILMLVAIWFGAGRLIRPIRKIEAEAIVVKGLSFADGDHYDTAALDVLATRRDEIGDLAEAFSDLTSSLEDNVGQRLAVEADLNTAAGIQRSLLPLGFPVPPHDMEFALHAALVPAKEVGGDWYDWGSIDTDRYFVLVADVSGKGVPAALFMAATKTLIRSGAMSKEPLDALMTRVNAEIAESNPEFMFATVWIGVLDVRSGDVEFVNAGHNPPLLNDTYVTERHGPFIGPMPGVTYTTGKFTMQSGDRLIVYSDGVTEAMAPDGELFGENRLRDLDLPGNPIAASKTIVDDVLAWEQGDRSDDVTVLVLDFFGVRSTETLSFAVHDRDPAIATAEVMERVDEFGFTTDVPAAAIAKIQLVLDEVVTNVLNHGDADDLRIDLNSRPGYITTIVSDNGRPYDPFRAPEPDVSLGLHERTPGGLGVMIVKNVMSDVSYTYANGRNVLTLTLEVPA